MWTTEWFSWFGSVFGNATERSMARLNRGVKDDPSDLRLSRWEDAEDRAGSV
ncbi:uncharacterized protein TrAtP1_006260 [Trichoderma atroviride]|uniref:uncharacterized protein n=1 Tax=Hypocrea atroviridis TaxID=63577 RepID=UPI00332741D2|nr:hypothetical protein TrAtP1_006260 [Trichoderma atroviride]